MINTILASAQTTSQWSSPQDIQCNNSVPHVNCCVPTCRYGITSGKCAVASIVLIIVPPVLAPAMVIIQYVFLCTVS